LPTHKKWPETQKNLYKDLGDGQGEASALLLLAGANLGKGDFEDSRMVAKDVRDLFGQLEDSAGEQAAEDFLENLKNFESGKSDHRDFMGFAIKQSGEKKMSKEEKKKAAAANQDIQVVSDIWSFSPFPTNNILAWFNSLEGRAAAPQGGARAPKKAELGVEAAKDINLSTFCVRMVPFTEDMLPHDDDKPKLMDDEENNPADNVVSTPVAMGPPKTSMYRNCITNRMLQAVQ